MSKRKAEKQTRMVGMRVSEDFFALINEGAEVECVSPTAFARLTLARALNFEEVLPETRARKSPRKKPVSSNIEAAIAVLGLLIDIRMSLSYLSRNLSEAHTLNPLRAEQVIEQGKRIDAIRRDFNVIRSHILGGQA
ncbi:hypothetical protein ACFE33_15790 (plasmid) [Falsihalocynthiibacter sp. SS001]|uniref:hypothetical protein n=1 Tax=Falsihalocynthiibacter sp. SS001 TaxID=3349698 RepID=UPI0036D294BB